MIYQYTLSVLIGMVFIVTYWNKLNNVRHKIIFGFGWFLLGYGITMLISKL